MKIFFDVFFFCIQQSRSKTGDPEQQKLKQKAKELQQAEAEEVRQREANLTALAAIGPRKKRKIDAGGSDNYAMVRTLSLCDLNAFEMSSPNFAVKGFKLHSAIFCVFDNSIDKMNPVSWPTV